MNIIMIVAGGVGNRFGDAMPKQYHLVNGRPAIEYVINAALQSNADEVIVVASKKYHNFLSQTYGVITVQAGDTRNRTIQKGIDYITHSLPVCEKLIIVDGVTVTITADRFDRYFEYLDKYDSVVTTAKISASLGAYDIPVVDREKYYLIMSPDAVRFSILKKYFDGESAITAVTQQLPECCRRKLCFDFDDYWKITYPQDIKIVEALMEYREAGIRFNAHQEDTVLHILAWLRKIYPSETRNWEKAIDCTVDRLLAKWDITQYSVNGESHFGIVLDCMSRKYGAVVIKIIPPFIKRYQCEKFAYKQLPSSYMCKLIDCDDESCALLLERAIPGDYVSYNADTTLLLSFYQSVYKQKLFINCDALSGEMRYLQRLEKTYLRTDGCEFQRERRARLQELAISLYAQTYDEEVECYLHGDMREKNLLKHQDGVIAIDPCGIIAPIEFEFTRMILFYLLRVAKTERKSVFEKYLDEMTLVADRHRLKSACFIDLVYLVSAGIIEENDQYNLCSQWLELIEQLF